MQRSAQVEMEAAAVNHEAKVKKLKETIDKLSADLAVVKHDADESVKVRMCEAHCSRSGVYPSLRQPRDELETCTL